MAAGESEPVWAEIVPDSVTCRRPDEPRRPASVWSRAIRPCLLTVGVVVAAAIASIAAVVVALLLTGGPELFSAAGPEMVRDLLPQLTGSPWGLAVMIVPGQLVFLAAGLAGARCERPFRLWPRLGLSSGALAPAWWPLLVVATPFVGVLASELFRWTEQAPSEQLDMLQATIAQHGGRSLPILVVLICALPGLAEELMFRGYLQRRLLAGIRPGWAIALSSLLFAAAHIDPVHALGVLPLGFWLGFIAWRCDSIVPAIVCHAANNLLAVAAVVLADPEMLETNTPESMPPGVVLGYGLLFAAAVLVLWRLPRRPTEGPALAPKPSPEFQDVRPPPVRGPDAAVDVEQLAP